MQNTRSLISVDDLTQLNNRGHINRYMEQIYYTDNSRVIIMMIDIDRFKSINDTYGHAEGDRALIIVSETLRQACERIKASVFLGRYGGDEFLIIIRTPDSDESPEKITGMIHSILSEKKQKNHIPYELSVSIGFDEMTDSNDTVYACMKRADEKLYIGKKRKNQYR
ncbi:MAG TPA: GGDEF domain-containing protein [Lachnospiraceae bacterium]|nr:GGDEF domain-containing protein [Lachnospiraceae bacterium]